MKNILVIGSINADMVIYTEKMPQMGETIHGHSFAINAGGKGANQAVAAAKLGASVKMIGKVGSDANGAMLLDNFRASGVGTDGIDTWSGPCGVAVITVCNGDNCIILDGGANDHVDPAQIDAHRDLIQWADFLIFQLEIPMETVLHAAKLAKSYAKTVVLNPAPITPIPPQLLSCTDLIVPNQSEAEGLLHRSIHGIEDAKKAALEIQGMGVAHVIITLGSDGCVYTCGQEVYHHGIIPTKVVDTTAAGDSFIAGVVTSLAEGCSMDEAIGFATRVSSITVSRAGAQSSLPLRCQL